MKMLIQSPPQVAPQVRFFGTPLKSLKTQGLHTHPPVTTPPHHSKRGWSRVGVCVVGRVSGVCSRWGLGSCGVVGLVEVVGGEEEVIFLSRLSFWKYILRNFIFEVTGFFMKGQVRLKKIIQVAAVLKSGLGLQAEVFGFFVAGKGGFK